jgi:hypothetical protein
MTHEMISNRNMAVLVNFAPAARHRVCRRQRDRRHPRGWVCRPLTNHYHCPFQHAITLRTPAVSLSPSLSNVALSVVPSEAQR